MAAAIQTKCIVNLAAMLSYTGSCRESSSAICSIAWQYRPIQAVPSACSSVPPPGRGAERSNTPMLSSPRKPPWNRLRSSGSLRFTHHVKFSSSRWNTRSRKLDVAGAADLPLALVEEERRPRMQRRVDVAEVPLVGRDLAVGVQVAVLQQQLHLRLGEVDVDERDRDRLERQVPGGEPRVLPFVGHRDHVTGHEVEPRRVAHALS